MIGQVRRTAAGRMYESLMTLDDLLDEDSMAEVMALLGDTDWSVPRYVVVSHSLYLSSFIAHCLNAELLTMCRSSPVPEVKVIRNRLCDLLKIPVPVAVSADKVLACNFIY